MKTWKKWLPVLAVSAGAFVAGASGMGEQAHAGAWDFLDGEGLWTPMSFDAVARCPGGRPPVCVACSPTRGCVDTCNGLSWCPHDDKGRCNNSAPGPLGCRSSPLPLWDSYLGEF